MRYNLLFLFAFLLCGKATAAQDENVWIAANEKDSTETSGACFTLMPDGRLLLIGAHNVLQATEGYTDWEVAGERPSVYILCTQPTFRGEILAGTSGHGVWKSDDGGKTWVDKTAGTLLKHTTIQDFYINKQGHIYASGASYAIWRSRDNGESWQPTNGKLSGGETTLGARADGTIYVCGGRGIYRSDDEGDSFTQLQQWGDMAAISGEDVKVHSSGAVFIGSNGEGGLAWRSDREGKKFYLIDEIASVAAIAIDSIGVVYAYGFSDVYEHHHIFRSTDAGATWQPFDIGHKSNILFDMITTPEGYVFTSGFGIYRTKYRTHNAPTFWGRHQLCSAVEFFVIDSVVSSVEVVPSLSRNVRLETLSPLGASKVKIRLMLIDEQQPGYYTLRATNALGAEKLYSDTLGAVAPVVNIVQSRDTLWASGGYVYQWYRNGEKLEAEKREYIVPTEGGSYSVFVHNAYGCEIISESVQYTPVSVAEQPNAAAVLEQNAPNPFDELTQIGYTLEKRGHVRVIASDVAGRTLAVLVDGVQEPGRYCTSFSAIGLTAGVYYYRLEIDGAMISRRMAVVR